MGERGSSCSPLAMLPWQSQQLMPLVHICLPVGTSFPASLGASSPIETDRPSGNARTDASAPTAANLKNLPHGRIVRFVHSSLAIQAAIDGQGIALGDSTLVADDLAAGRLIKPFDLVLQGPPECAYFLVSRRGLAKDGIEARFRDWLLGEIASPAPVKRAARRSRARG